MEIKKVVKCLNAENTHNLFRLTSLGAKRDRGKHGDWVLIKFVNQHLWRDFTPGEIELYEAIPSNYLLTRVAKRLDCSVDEIQIIDRYCEYLGRWMVAFDTIKNVKGKEQLYNESN